MINRQQIKTEAKNHLKGNWKYPIFISLVVLILSSLFNFKSSMTYVTGIQLNQTDQIFSWIWYVFSFIISVAASYFYLSFIREREKTNFQTFLDGFDLFFKAILTFLMLVLRIFAWSLLLIIPGIIKAFAYSQVGYIIADFPGIKVNDAFKMSSLITNGYKLDIFVFYLSFLGWLLISIVTFGIASIWISPYIDTASTKLYLRLKETAIEAKLIHINRSENNTDTEDNSSES